MSSTAVQLVFAGEILAGFSQAQVREKLGRRLRLDEQRLNKLFSGQRVVIKRDLSPSEAAEWVERFRAIGAVLHAMPSRPPSAQTPPTAAAPTPPPKPAAAPKGAPPPKSAPTRRPQAPPPDSSLMLSLVPDSELPPARSPTPAAAASPRAVAPLITTSTSPEEIVCPNCGERQSKRIICRSCVCDMPRTLASRQAEAEVRRQARIEEQRARNEHRLARSQGRPDDDADEEGPLDADPPLLSLSPEGRMGRLRFFTITVASIPFVMMLLALAFAYVAARPSPVNWVMLILVCLGLLLWNLRVTALRLHDFDFSGLWALLMFVPGINGFFTLALLLWPGSSEENDYGLPVDDGNLLLALMGLVALGASAMLASSKYFATLLGAVG